MQAADLRVSIKGSATVKHEVREGKDGGLEVTYAAPMSGEYRISISMGPTPVPGSPFRCTSEVYITICIATSEQARTMEDEESAMQRPCLARTGLASELDPRLWQARLSGTVST